MDTVYNLLDKVTGALFSFNFTSDLLDILFVTIVIFELVKLIRGSRTFQVIKGIVLLFVVYVAINYPKGVTQYGGTVSAPIAKNIMKNIISIKGLKPSKDVTPRTYTWLDTKYVQVPNVIGLSKKEITKVLKGFEIIYSGVGDKVIYQDNFLSY